MADDRLPKRGPGRQDNGNFHLSEIEITIGSRVKVRSPSADHDQDGWTVAARHRWQRTHRMGHLSRSQ
jgi:hypothetical protein